jgi:transcriptional regulator of acetoin/glycerol metabolism
MEAIRMQLPAKSDSTDPPAVTPRAAALFFSTQEQRVTLAREMFFEEGQRPSGLVSELVIQSWMRCAVANRRPSEKIHLEPVSKARISRALERNRLLLHAACSDLQELDAVLAGTRCKALLTGPDGVLIQATPTARGEGSLMPCVARLGVNLNETHIGTTAPSVVMRTGEACVVRGSEHFFTTISVMHCAATPIRDARGDLAGVLDLSIEGDNFRFDATAMVRLYATAIENRLFEAQSASLLLLRFQSSPALLQTPLVGLAAVDGNGGVAWLNQTGAKLLGTERVPTDSGDTEALFGLGLEDLLSLYHRGKPQPCLLPNGLTLWIHAGKELSREKNIEPALSAKRDRIADVQAITTLHRANHFLIESTLATCNGNVSLAARQLGVSRGLLYRKLRAMCSSPKTVP